MTVSKKTLSRSSYYYQPTGETEGNLHFMRLLDEQYTRTPFYGICAITNAREYDCVHGHECAVAQYKVRVRR